MSSAFAIGDLVIIDPQVATPAYLGKVYRVTRLLKVNVVIEPVGGGRGVRVKPDLLQPAPTDTAQTTPTSAAEVVPYQAPLDAGAVVTVAGPRWTQPADQLYVVLRDKGDRVSIVKLGGDDGRYWPRVPRAMLTVVEPNRIHLSPPA